MTSHCNSSLRKPIHPLVLLVPGAIILRILTFLGRGDFVAFDEGWYLLLGRSLWAGDGYTLTGLRHTTLSPLFPILAGGLALILDNLVWAGRLVAAIASGLLVLPCWSIFNRLAGCRTALVGSLIIAVLPSLIPFTVPYWVGWDLWMGPEPIYHLCLYSGIALALRARELSRIKDWALSGVAFALAYLARPEAIVIGALLILVLVATTFRRSPKSTFASATVFALAFCSLSAPYWLYLHDALGRWTISGRHVEIALPGQRTMDTTGRGGRASTTIEQMIWQGEQDGYADVLFALHPSGIRLASSYWGVPRTVDGTHERVAPSAEVSPAHAEQFQIDTGPDDGGSESELAVSSDTHSEFLSRRVTIYLRALGIVVPGFIWPFVILGLVARRRHRSALELITLGPLASTSPLIAGAVAIDPRTQLFLAPLLAFYAARGIRVLGVTLDRKLSRERVRRGLVAATITTVVLSLLLVSNASRLYSSISEGSPHHVLGAENRRVARELHGLVPEDKAIMSWDPSVAIYARRDWRVLPYGSLQEIVRYAASTGCEYVLLSRLYPAPQLAHQVPANHLLLRVPASAADAVRWRVELTGRGAYIAVGDVIVD